MPISSLWEENMTRIYLDHAATTFAEDAVILAMAQCMRETPYNASAAYSAAGEARRIHRLCRNQLARMLACPAQDLFFTSGGTESNNWAVKSFAGRHAVIAAIEHHSILHAALAAGCAVTLVQPDETGYISPAAIEAALRPDTALICLQAANNETGVIQPICDTYAIARARGIHMHVDAVQAFGHIPLSAAHCDSMSLSAHKLCGPRGIGALVIRSGAQISPLLHGGGQESGLRAGTENTPAIRGFEIAAQMADDDMLLRMHRERAMLSQFETQILQRIPGAAVLGSSRERLPGVTAILLPALSAEEIIAALDLQGILISGGAACASHAGEPSHVYTAMGLTRQQAARVIRVSIGRHTTQDELDRAAQAIDSLILPPARQNTSR